MLEQPAGIGVRRALHADRPRTRRAQHARDEREHLGHAAADDDPRRVGVDAAHAPQVLGQRRPQPRMAGRVRIAEVRVDGVLQRPPLRRRPRPPREQRQIRRARPQVVASDDLGRDRHRDRAALDACRDDGCGPAAHGRDTPRRRAARRRPRQRRVRRRARRPARARTATARRPASRPLPIASRNWPSSCARKGGPLPRASTSRSSGIEVDLCTGRDLALVTRPVRTYGRTP